MNLVTNWSICRASARGQWGLGEELDGISLQISHIVDLCLF